jgi:hypothetical protein
MDICSRAIFWVPFTFSAAPVSAREERAPARGRRREGRVMVSMAVVRRAEACQREEGSRVV